MKEKGRSRALHKKPYGLCKRFLAAMIAAVMVTTNIGTDLTTAYAAESSDSVTFEMSGSGLVTAIEEAIADAEATKAVYLRYLEENEKEQCSKS